MRIKLLFVCIVLFCFSTNILAQEIPQLPIGMNVGANNYYSQCVVYNDVMKTASPWISFNVENDTIWDTGLADSIPLDSCGYPVVLPYAPLGEEPQGVRTLINNNYLGTYILLFDGEGEITIHNAEHEQLGPNKYSIELNGYGGHVWIHIYSSTEGNHIRNMRIIPEEYDGHEEEMPLFNEKFLEGLEPFHAIRFMDWMETNGSEQEEWNGRVKTCYYSYGLGNGMPIEHAVRLCNELGADAWFCVPHQADDDYITKFAELVKDSLASDLKVYLEYSNEIWNWIFDQSHYVGQNAPGHNNQYVIDALTAIDPVDYCHPEKDAYMMQRTFGLWSDVFTGTDRERMVRVGTGQHAWMDNSRRILEYLFKKDMDGYSHTEPLYAASTGAGCDAFAVGGYFNFTEYHHNIWNSMDPDDVTPDMIIDAVFSVYDTTSGEWTDATAVFVNEFGVDYLVYEGGQHMQPWMQGEYDYNQAVWDAQIHPRMYDLYMYNFSKHTEVDVDCKLFMAFSYLGERESRYGSWGHLESIQQIGAGNYMTIAPKYQALLDANTPKTGVHDGRPAGYYLKVSPNPFNSITRIEYVIPEDGFVSIKMYNLLGQEIETLVSGNSLANNEYRRYWNASGFPAGIYFCQMTAGDVVLNKKIINVR
jgi:hypothetical protein